MPVLQNVQQLSLEGGVKVADLVEENGAAVGGLELADLELMRAGECAAFMAEEFALQELARDRIAVDLDEGATLPDGLAVNGARYEILASSRLARDEDGHVDASRLLDDLAHLAHLDAAPEAELRLQPAVHVVLGALPMPAWAGEGALDHVLEIIGRKGFLDEIVRSERGGLRGPLTVPLFGQQDDWPG